MELARALRLPYPRYLATVVFRSAALWLLLRLFLAVGLFYFLGPAALLIPATGIPAVLVWIDRRNARELLLHANLGASELWFWAAALLPALLLDVAAHLLLAPLL